MAEAFADLLLDELEEDGYWPDYQLSYLSQRGVEIAAGIDEGTETLYLAVTDFEHTSSALTMSATERTKILKRLVNFVQKARARAINLGDHNPVVDLAQMIEEAEQFSSVRCFLLTNRIVHADEPEGKKAEGWLRIPLPHLGAGDDPSVPQTGASLDPIKVLRPAIRVGHSLSRGTGAI